MTIISKYAMDFLDAHASCFAVGVATLSSPQRSVANCVSNRLAIDMSYIYAASRLALWGRRSSHPKLRSLL